MFMHNTAKNLHILLNNLTFRTWTLPAKNIVHYFRVLIKPFFKLLQLYEQKIKSQKQRLLKVEHILPIFKEHMHFFPKPEEV